MYIAPLVLLCLVSQTRPTVSPTGTSLHWGGRSNTVGFDAADSFGSSVGDWARPAVVSVHGIDPFTYEVRVVVHTRHIGEPVDFEVSLTLPKKETSRWSRIRNGDSAPGIKGVTAQVSVTRRGSTKVFFAPVVLKESDLLSGEFAFDPERTFGVTAPAHRVVSFWFDGYRDMGIKTRTGERFSVVADQLVVTEKDND